jgi:DNA-binding MarR family transcriptional regulator
MDTSAGERRLAAGLRRLAQSFTLRSLQEWRVYVKSSGLSIQQYIVLMQLLHGGSCGVHQIAERLEISSPAASQQVDRLVQAGLAERAESREDRRSRRVSLTARGRDLVSRGFAGPFRWVDELAAAVDAEDRAAVLAALPRLLRAERRLGGPRLHRAHGRPAGGR